MSAPAPKRLVFRLNPILRRPAAGILLLAAMATCVTAPLPPLLAQTNDPRSGAIFQKELASDAGLTWTDSPLREGLQRLSERRRVAVFLDRQVDPDQTVSFTSSGGTLEDVFAELTEQLGLAYCLIDSVIYIGPPEKVDRLATHSLNLRDQLRKADGGSRSGFLQREAFEWEDYTAPSQLFEQCLAAQTAIHFAGATPPKLPYDLWAKNHLPALPWLDAMNLLLVGFELTVVINIEAQSYEISPLPAGGQYTKSYRSRPSVTLEQLRTGLDQSTLSDRAKSEASLTGRGNQLIVKGSYLVHQQVSRLLANPDRAADADLSNKRYTLENTRAPAGAVVQTVAKQLNLEIVVAESAEMLLQQPVELNVKDVTIDELLRRALNPVGAELRTERPETADSPQMTLAAVTLAAERLAAVAMLTMPAGLTKVRTAANRDFLVLDHRNSVASE